jgi:hypothetical protein
MTLRRALGLTLLAGLLLGLLAVPAALAGALPGGQPPPLRPLLIFSTPVLQPISNTHTAPATSSVSILYSEPIDPASVSTRTFAVHAMQTGLLTGTYHVSGGAISLAPGRPFKPGELVQASATTRTLNLAGQGPVSPTVWSFHVAAAGGYAHFTPSGQTFPYSDTVAVALGDLDGDGDLDAVVANWIGQDNEVWLNDGHAWFTRTSQTLGTIASLGMALGDLDGDGDLDAVIPNAEAGRLDAIWFNDGRGRFTQSSQIIFSNTAGRAALGDLDGDGDLDILLGRFRLGAPRHKQIWLNDGTGVFSNTGQLLGDVDTFKAVLGDLDGDGDLDAFAANGMRNMEAQPNQVWLNDGRGVFTSPYPGLGNARSTAVDLGDLDGDGDLDAFVTNYPDEPEEVWFNDGRGRFSDSGQRLGNEETYDVALGDVDGDGDLDALVANANMFGDYAQPNRLWLNDGAGFFTPTDQAPGGPASFSVALGDLDGDGDLDAFVGNSDLEVWDTPGGSPNQVWLNEPRRLFLPQVAASDGPDFTVRSVRQLTPCENEGKHHIFARVIDTGGNGLQGVPLLICWGAGTSDCARPITDEAGWAVFAMFKGIYSVRVATGTSQAASGLTGDFAVDEMCEETGNPVANARYHVSFEVIFVKEK